MGVRIFSGAAEFREWLERNHGKAQELWVGIHNKRASATSITYREALDEALCFGWIDGVRKSVDATTYTVRFTPRKGRSYWSTVNAKRFGELKKQGRLTAAGMAAFENRSRDSGKYSFENRPGKFDAALEKQFRANKKAWAFFGAQAPWYQRTAIFWVVSAKKQETQLKRLSTLIRDSEGGRRLAMLTPKSKEGR
jgi:uncharacterized protein YdeI (YjbR/CyaY-like superfamily)